MALVYGRAGRLTAKNGGFRPGQCNNQPCPINCEGFWKPYTPCNKQCGGGMQYSYFQVTTSPQHGGRGCTPDRPGGPTTHSARCS